VLREIMDANGLRQKDLVDDLGDESIVSLILKEKRQLNRQQMEKLSRRLLTPDKPENRTGSHLHLLCCSLL
jgi:antitoxin component HigA of HigAB toxin-antitoxin module